MTDSKTTPTDDQRDDRPQPEGQTPQGVPYSRFKDVNDRLKALQREMAEQDAAWATEAADWERKIAGAQEEAQRLQLAIVRSDIGREVGLPLELADRLVGNDEDALRADAERLVRMLPGLKANAAPEFSPEQLADPGFYARNRARIMGALKAGRLR